MPMKYLIVSAFPRSGSVFFAKCLEKYRGTSLNAQVSSFHIPYILDNSNLCTATIIRNPYDVLSSLYYQRQAKSGEQIMYSIEDMIYDYSLYLSYAQQYRDSDHLQIVDFEKMKNNPVDQTIKYYNKFNVEYNESLLFTDESLNENIKNEMINMNAMDELGGHMPREKTSNREFIENYISELDILKPVYENYQNTIKFSA